MEPEDTVRLKDQGVEKRTETFRVHFVRGVVS